VVWLRQDPPFDMGYITTTHILDMLQPTTLVVNDPFWVRNYPEKLLVLQFPDLTPPTTVARDIIASATSRPATATSSSSRSTATAARACSASIPTTATSTLLWELFTGTSREPLIAQKFLPDVSQGDKRVILVDGEPVGAINRVPQEGETRSNMHAGGRR
jgi:glutathione synthase